MIHIVTISSFLQRIQEHQAAIHVKKTSVSHESYGPKKGRKAGGADFKSLRQAESTTALDVDDYVDRGIYGIMLQKDQTAASGTAIERKK